MSRDSETLAGNAVDAIRPRVGLSQRPYLVRYIYRHTLRFLKFVAARIDLEHFPGSCCG
jgi:hypothetical protein